MKILLITDPAAGKSSAYLFCSLLQRAIDNSGLMLTDNIADATLVIMAGEQAPSSVELQGKRVWSGALREALLTPDQLLAKAQQHAQLWQSRVATTRQVDDRQKPLNIVAVTACPTGVAHTFMAAEAIEAEAARRGWQVRVETRGSVGAGNPITADEIAAADLVIVAADIDVDLAKFAGKRLYRTSTGLALKKTASEFERALQEARPWQPEHQPQNNRQGESSTGIYRHLLTGVSWMLPMVVAGGLCIALSFAFGITAYEQPGTLAAALKQIGGDTAFALMIPVLAGYIAFSIADRPGLTPGMIGGMLASSINAGFLGGIIAGFIAGYCARLISTRLRLPQSMEALKPILIIPLVASLITGLLMIYVVGTPVAGIMEALTQWLQNIGTGNAVLLGLILGGMMCSDMGGPINKASYAFGVTLLSTHIYAPMAAIMAAGMVPPLAMGVATLIARKKFNQNQREGGKASLVLGLCFITEGAIPFAARDPMRVIPCCMVGGALTGAISMAVGAKLMTPHGGLFVLAIPGAITPVIAYLTAIAIGTLVAAIAYAFLKKMEAE